MSADIIQFSHANGFPARTYDYLFECLQPFEVNYVNQYGHGDYPIQRNWEKQTIELIKSIEAKSDQPVIGIGHSFGAALTLFASQQRPDLFKQVIMMDPPLFLSYKKHFIRVTKALNIHGRMMPESRKSRVRKNQFSSRQEAFEYYKTKALFNHFHPRCYDDYIEYGIAPKGDGFELSFSPQVEYKIFKAIPGRLSHLELPVPTQLVYSNRFSVLEKVDLEALKKTFKGLELLEFNGGHLFPLEKPEEVAELLKSMMR